jgi:hypothetical protein
VQLGCTEELSTALDWAAHRLSIIADISFQHSKDAISQMINMEADLRRWNQFVSDSREHGRRTRRWSRPHHSRPVSIGRRGAAYRRRSRG